MAPLDGRFAAIVLAAGDGSRLGGRCKADLRLPSGETFLEAIVRSARGGGVSRVVVVCGASVPGDVPAGCELVRNLFPENGMLSSIHAGLEALQVAPQGPAADAYAGDRSPAARRWTWIPIPLAVAFDPLLVIPVPIPIPRRTPPGLAPAEAASLDGALLGALVWPVDCPRVPADVVASLLEAGRRGAPIAIPTFDGRRGHPALFSTLTFRALMDAPLAEGARAVVRAHGEAVEHLALGCPEVLDDVDTPADLARVGASCLGPRVQEPEA